MIVLGIESSCDETAAAIVNDRREILGDCVLTQLEHKIYGGVVPEIAARSHLEHIDDILEETFKRADLKPSDIDAVAASSGPGLIGGVVIGVMAAKALALALNKPFIAVNHLEGHALAARLTNDVEYPYLLLLVSGGHCQILIVKGVGDFERLGTTIDDAAGEAFDKVARLMGLTYPGGAKMDKLAALGDPGAVFFPEAHVKDSPYDFSFSGLKTAAINHLHTLSQKGLDFSKEDVAASFTAAVCKALSSRVEKLFESPEFTSKKLVLAGGVSANSHIRKALGELCKKHGVTLYLPPLPLCGDNGVMIAAQGYYEFIGKTADFRNLALNAYATADVECGADEF